MSVLISVVGGLAIVFVIMIAIAGPSQMRFRTLQRRRPTALILTAVTPRGSQAAGQELMRVYSPQSRSRLPTWMAVSVDSDALRFWSGGINPKQLFEATLHQIVSVNSAIVQESERSDRALELEFALERGNVKYPMVILGRGFLGLFPKSDAELAEISIELKKRIGAAGAVEA
ncbi:hypothetical protein [Subtercola frigoramans]|uniref:Uncharacterized protein n=1 Tax=Subtercola frigoramans TaxID=120298 RepID=A0ABS2L0E0_9MICO|nr:hypothetical protein [Subtercola frigoramans]MBM7470532.1 hypothetical protein [Subtercola frigoramans]